MDESTRVSKNLNQSDKSKDNTLRLHTKSASFRTMCWDLSWPTKTSFQIRFLITHFASTKRKMRRIKHCLSTSWDVNVSWRVRSQRQWTWRRTCEDSLKKSIRESNSSLTSKSEFRKMSQQMILVKKKRNLNRKPRPSLSRKTNLKRIKRLGTTWLETIVSLPSHSAALLTRGNSNLT